MLYVPKIWRNHSFVYFSSVLPPPIYTRCLCFYFIKFKLIKGNKLFIHSYFHSFNGRLKTKRKIHFKYRKANCFDKLQSPFCKTHQDQKVWSRMRFPNEKLVSRESFDRRAWWISALKFKNFIFSHFLRSVASFTSLMFPPSKIH